jgi:hypothetical protein
MGPLFAGIAAATANVCKDYSEEQLRLVMEVMGRLTDASHAEALALRTTDPRSVANAECALDGVLQQATRFEQAGAAPHRAKKKPQKPTR